MLVIRVKGLYFMGNLPMTIHYHFDSFVIECCVVVTDIFWQTANILQQVLKLDNDIFCVKNYCVS